MQLFSRRIVICYLQFDASKRGGTLKASLSPAQRFRLDLVEPTPVASRELFWRRTTEIAIIGIFFLFVLAALQFSRALLLPVTLAIVVGMMMAPLVKGLARIRISPWIASLLLVSVFFVALCILIVVVSGLVSEWVAKNSEMGQRFATSFSSSSGRWRRYATSKADFPGRSASILARSNSM